MVHFTYEENIDLDCLKQGDLLLKDSEFNTVLEKVHPHFAKEEYQHFLVLTQSCDLYRSTNRKEKTKYITIAAVRPLEYVLKKEATKFSTSYLEKKTNKIYDEQKKAILSDFVEKLLNNNSPDYFYLHNNELIQDPLVAILRVSFVLRIEHYNLCLKCKKLELDNSFKAKLGWLVGNLYSRVSTEDWESYKTKRPDSNIEEIVNDILTKNYLFVKNIKTFEGELFKIKKKEEIDELNNQQIIELIKKLPPQSKKVKFDKLLFDIIKNADIINDAKIRKKLYNLIINDNSISELLK